MNNGISITLTADAIEHIQTVLARHGEAALGFRLSMRQAGCSGYMYEPAVITEILEQDVELDLGTPFRIFIDQGSMVYFAGTEIDYVSKCVGMKQLVFNNPNVMSTCGCGESVMLTPEVESKESADEAE